MRSKGLREQRTPSHPSKHLPLMASLLSAVLLLAAVTAWSPAAGQAQAADVWPTYLANLNHRAYNAAFHAFGPATAPSISKKWSAYTSGQIVDNPAVAVVSNIHAGGCSGTSVVVAFAGTFSSSGGTGGAPGYLYAVNASTGALCWKTFLAADVNPHPNQLCITTQAIAASPTVATVSIKGVAKPVVYVAASDIVFALNAATGGIIWKNALAGHGVGTFSTTMIWSSPSVVNGRVYISTASFCDETNPVDGAVYSLNAVSGGIVAKHSMLPNNAPGGGVWGSPTVSPSTGTVYVTTGNTYVAGQQACSTGQPLSCAIVALDWNTLAVKASWQVPANQFVPDGDFGTTPTLFPGSGGATWLGAGNKNGRYYVLDAGNLTAGPKWQVQMANGGGNPVDGIIAPTAYYPLSITAGGTRCTGVLFLAAGSATFGGTAYGANFSALCATTGKQLWRVGAAGHTLGAPVLANGMLADAQGATLEVRNWSTGALLFHFAAGTIFEGAPAFANGLLYAGSLDHKLYAFGP
ncbi:MAG: PQQ-binding-like beta-propeller repeat protein [Ktedonobacterales bacterium]